MGTAPSKDNYEQTKEKPAKDVVATLYYLPGRGVADPIRWLLAAANISFIQRVVNSREKFFKLCERQLPFGQLPLLLIDNLEIVQSNAIIRYLAKRSQLSGENVEEEVKCDMTSEAVRDLISVVAVAPFHRAKSTEAASAHVALMKEKWAILGSRFEVIIQENGSQFLVGKKLTYVDVLVAHAMTWFVEEVSCVTSSIHEHHRLMISNPIFV
jgi:glutathione S-transferase